MLVQGDLPAAPLKDRDLQGVLQNHGQVVERQPLQRCVRAGGDEPGGSAPAAAGAAAAAPRGACSSWPRAPAPPGCSSARGRTVHGDRRQNGLVSIVHDDELERGVPRQHGLYVLLQHVRSQNDDIRAGHLPAGAAKGHPHQRRRRRIGGAIGRAAAGNAGRRARTSAGSVLVKKPRQPRRERKGMMICQAFCHLRRARGECGAGQGVCLPCVRAGPPPRRRPAAPRRAAPARRAHAAL